MNYLISREELKYYLNDINGVQQLGDEVVEEIVSNFFKSKQPVELYNDLKQHIFPSEVKYLETKIQQLEEENEQLKQNIYTFDRKELEKQIKDLKYKLAKIEEAYNEKQQLVNVLYKQLASIK